MGWNWREGIVAVAAVLTTAASAVDRAMPQAGATCRDLLSLRVPDIEVSDAEILGVGPFRPPGGGRGVDVPVGACRVVLTARPSSDSDIKIEVWLPAAGAWNGKLLGVDNGGFSGTIDYGDLATGVRRGYAAVGTDTGHTGDQMEFGEGHPEKVIDWSFRAVHVMTVAAKAVVEQHYGRAPAQSYFQGCSTGGQQALSEVQRFPGDYSGVVAGDPGNNRVNLILGFLWGWTALHGEDGTPLLAASKLPMLTHAVVAACDRLDGLEDGLIGDPRQCRFDPAELACSGGDVSSCLTATEVTAVKKVYAGARNARTGEQIYPGWLPGTELGWGAYLLNPREPVRIGLFRSFLYGDSSWHWRSFDWDRDVASVRDRMSHLSAMSTDLTTFKARGGKLLMYTGWADPVVPATDTVAYYEALVQTMGGAERTDDFARLFVAPGMAHCGGGTGPNTFDALGALEAWVERGTAPDSISASHSTGGRAGGAVDRTRPLCRYPQVARYNGTGSIDDGANFTCALPR